MKNKKLIRLILAFVTIGTLISGCAGSGEENSSASGLLAAVSNNNVCDNTPELEGYTILWSDEFDGTTLDESKWTREQRSPGWTNGELQEYTSSDDNIFLRDGCLVLRAIEEERNGSPYYTSGKVNSRNKQDFMYGKVVVSACVPEGQGLWPAIWMMPNQENYYGSWPKCGEIDIMEILGNDVTTSYSTIHYGNPHSQQQGLITLDNGSFADGFHEYSVEWEPGEMRFYTDDVLVLTVNDWYCGGEGVDKEYPAPFNQNFFVQMNLAVGGSWPGNPDETTDFENAEFLIDYVRVYQKDSYDTNVTRPAMVFSEPDENGNYINNGDFSVQESLNDNVDWFMLCSNGGVAEATISDNMIVIDPEDDGEEEYSIQLVQAGQSMYKGHTYRLSFDIMSETERDAVVCVSAPNFGYIRYLEDQIVDIGTEWESYTYEFTVDSADDNNGRLEFNMGNHGFLGTVYIRNIVLIDVTEGV